MRILLANDGIGDAGGVQSYLAAVAPALEARGHAVALLHLDPLRDGSPSPLAAGAPHFGMAARGEGPALAEALDWAPDLAFVHNMRPLSVDRWLLDRLPVVKMMHGYFGTCVSGQKAHLLPVPRPCARPLGPGCLVLYGPRRCGSLRPGYVARQWRWAREQRRMLSRYTRLLVASDHMRGEFLGSGAPAERLAAIPLFPTVAGDPSPARPAFSVLFLGRMTPVKGGDLLIRAVARASADLGRRLPVVLAGGGPERASWERLAARLGVDATFTGWVDRAALPALFRSASLLAMPSVWPEPFGLAGLEAAAFGVPAVGFAAGGTGEWLVDGVNGRRVPADPPTADALAAALAEAATRPATRAAWAAGALEAARRLSLARHVDRLESLLAAAAGEGPAVLP
jgi:glycosyltransferase involved in cell wall biosynthesis